MLCNSTSCSCAAVTPTQSETDVRSLSEAACYKEVWTSGRGIMRILWERGQAHRLKLSSLAEDSFLTHLVDGRDPVCSSTGGQREDGHLLTLHPARLQTVLPLFDDTGLRVRVVWDPDGGHAGLKSGTLWRYEYGLHRKKQAGDPSYLSCIKKSVILTVIYERFQTRRTAPLTEATML